MRPVSAFEGTVQGNLDGERIKMGIGEGAEDVIISIVTDLYSDPEMAVVREYSTNARDSHIEAGNPAPIEVNTPTELSPYLVIKDFGVGLSVDDIKKVYSQYGASTKRESDLFNGMLGVGGKSALAYTDQFTVSSVKNGVKAQVIVTRDENLRPIMEVVDTRGTTEPNGVEIRIPAKYGSRLHQKAIDFFRFWNPETVLLNGKPPVTIFDQDFKKITETIYSFPRLDGDYIVMGNVAYRLADKALTEAYAENSWYAGTVSFVEMGDIIFPPSRESVAYTPHTKAAIAKMVEEIKASVREQILEDIKDATTHTEAFRSWKKWVDIVGSGNMPSDIDYKGDKFVQQIRNISYLSYRPEGGRYNSNGTRSGKVETNHAIYLETLTSTKSMIVEDFTKTEMTSTDKAKVKVYLQENGINADTVLFFDTIPGAPWTDEVETVAWEDIKSIKLNRNAAKIRGLTGSIPIKVWKDSYWRDLEDLDDQAPIFYLSPAKDERWSEDDQAIKIFQDVYPDAQIIRLGKNRWTKLEREFPTAKHIDPFMSNVVAEVEKTLTPDDKRILRANKDDIRAMRKYKDWTIDDPELNDAVAISALDSTRADLYTTVVYKFNSYGTKEKYAEKNSVLTKRYPMVGTYSYNRIPVEHEVIYINAVYAAKYKESN
jgi:hypothetical protein